MNILRTEWLKMKGYWAFWGVLAITALSYPGINYLFWNEYKEMVKKSSQMSGIAQMLLGNPFMFPEAFHTVAFFSSVFVLIPALVVIMLVTNEYTYKTHRQNIIDGWSRDTFMLAKFVDVLMITLLVTIIYSIVAYVIGTVATDQPVEHPFSKVYYIGLFALQTLAQLSVAFLMGFLLRRALIALGLFLFYYVILENGIIAFLREKKKFDAWFMPLEISDRLIPLPAFMGRFNEAKYKTALAAVQPHVYYTLILLALIWGFCWWLNRRRDL